MFVWPMQKMPKTKDLLLEEFLQLDLWNSWNYDWWPIKRFDNIYAAAGHPNSIFKIDYENLIKITDGKVLEYQVTITVDYIFLVLALIWASAFLILKFPLFFWSNNNSFSKSIFWFFASFIIMLFKNIKIEAF